MMTLRRPVMIGRSHVQRSALTLTEILIVIVILSIASLLVLPGLGGRDIQQARAAAQMLIADLEYARLQSIGNGADPCLVLFDESLQGYHLARQSDPEVPLRDPGTGLSYVTVFGEGRAAGLAGVVIDGLDVGGDHRLAFTAFGAIDQGTAARIALRYGATTLDVLVDAGTGEPVVEDE